MVLIIPDVYALYNMKYTIIISKQSKEIIIKCKDFTEVCFVLKQLCGVNVVLSFFTLKPGEKLEFLCYNEYVTVKREK